ncbi:hypothetical protein AnigIFM60653_002096 [Aspergillus niger]|nr:hypothetical protein AnigIFM60653_002096 [Aspergillus niger]
MDSIMGDIYLKMTAIAQFDAIRRGEDEGGFPPETKTLLLSLGKTTLGLIPTVPFDNVIGGNAKSTTAISNALEQQLEAVFKIAKHFDTMLRLDEIAAFMEQRTSYHDTQNPLVTIFLRKLEY